MKLLEDIIKKNVDDSSELLSIRQWFKAAASTKK
jgi:hypothetical protein